MFDNMAPIMNIRASRVAILKPHEMEDEGVEDFGGRDFDYDDADREYVDSLGYDRLIPDDSY